jgi:PAS domain-containing protein
MAEKTLGKFPAIFIPVLLFILFDTVALGLNFWISAKLEKSAMAINLSGRQRMLSQRMTKSLLMLQVAQTDAQKLNAFTEFSNAVDLFDKTLTGFLQGGMTFSGDGKPVYLPATEAPNTQIITGSAVQLWTLIRKQLSPVEVGGASIGAEVLRSALDTLLMHNTPLLGLMNDLTTSLELNATREVYFLRTLQVSLLLLALLNFALVCKRLLAQVRQSQGNVQALRNIIDSIETGIVLYDGDERVRSANKAANQLFGYNARPWWESP